MAQEIGFSAVLNGFWAEKCPKLQYSGFKVFSEAQLSFIRSLADDNGNPTELFYGISGHDGKVQNRDPEGKLDALQMRFSLAACWVTLSINLEIPTFRKDINKPFVKALFEVMEFESDRVSVSSEGDIWQGIQTLEEWYQLKYGWCLALQTIEKQLDFTVKLENQEQPNQNYLIPLDPSWVGLIPQPKRQQFLEKLEKQTMFDLRPDTALGMYRESDEYKLLKYGNEAKATAK